MKKYKYLLQFVVVFMTFLVNEINAQQNDDLKTETGISNEDERHSFNEYKAIEKALQPYILAAKSGKADQLNTTFFDHAHIVGSIKGQFYNADLPTFQKSINAGGASPNVQHHIAWIDVTGLAAAAKVEFIDWSGFRFTDYFVLFKHQGKWRISGKVYDAHANK